jgi:mannose-6-phosphate isomerase
MKVIQKPWGREEWLVLNDKYCLKRLYIEKGHKLSLQYHEVKKETMFLEEGLCDLVFNGTVYLMKKDTPYTIIPGDVHRLIAHSDTIILEVSSPEVDDVVRVEDDYDRKSN